MLTVLRLRWDDLAESSWSLVRARLNSALLAPHGCLSWHTRRDGARLVVTALWDSQHRAQLFAAGHLAEVLRVVDLDAPETSQQPMVGLHATGPVPRGVPAGLAPAA